MVNLSEVLFDPATPWQRVTVPGWYGGGECGIEGSINTAACRYGGMPIVPIRWTRARDPNRRFEPQVLLRTDLAQAPCPAPRPLHPALADRRHVATPRDGQSRGYRLAAVSAAGVISFMLPGLAHEWTWDAVALQVVVSLLLSACGISISLEPTMRHLMSRRRPRVFLS
jgi:hypothetical protein